MTQRNMGFGSQLNMNVILHFARNADYSNMLLGFVEKGLHVPLRIRSLEKIKIMLLVIQTLQ